jgi:hypothetical protein
MKREHSHATIGLAASAIAAALLAAVAFAQDTAPAPAGEVGSKPGEGKDSKPNGTSPAPVGEVGSKPGEGKDSKPKGTSPTSSKSSPQRFEPTEKVRPDFDVAFPVDI